MRDYKPTTEKAKRRFASPLRKIRRARGWSQVRMAGIAGIDVKTVKALEERDPKYMLSVKLGTLFKLSAALNCAPSDLVPALKSRPGRDRREAARAEAFKRSPQIDRLG